MAVTIKAVNTQGQPYANADIHIDWSQLGIPAGSNEGYTDQTGSVTFSETFSLIGADGNGWAKSGLSYGSFSVHMDAFGNGSATVTLSLNPYAVVQNDVANIMSNIYIWLFAIVVIVVAVALIAVFTNSNPLSSAQKKLVELKEKVKK